jgi:hypothetical protein
MPCASIPRPRAVLPVASAAVLAAALAVVGGAGCRPLANSQLQSDTDEVCTLSTPADWQGFVDRSAGKLIEARFDDVNGFGSPTQQQAAGAVLAELKRCAAGVKASPAIAACTARLATFARSQEKRNDRSTMGFGKDNASYLASHETPDKPQGLMTFPEPLASGAQETLEDLETTALEHGWLYAIQRSALTRGPRAIIYIKGAQFDQWVVYDAEAGGEIARVPSIIGIWKTDAAGNPFASPKIYFRDIFLTGAGNASPTTPLVEDGAKCYACHPNGLRPLIPFQTQFTGAKPAGNEAQLPPQAREALGLRRIQQLNQVMASYGILDPDGHYSVAEQGPALGKSQGCVLCHNGANRDALTYYSMVSQVRQKLVDELSMPPSTHLTQLLTKQQQNRLTEAELGELDATIAARAKMFDKFEADRPLAVKQWLTATSCVPEQPTGRAETQP